MRIGLMRLTAWLIIVTTITLLAPALRAQSANWALHVAPAGLLPRSDLSLSLYGGNHAWRGGLSLGLSAGNSLLQWQGRLLIGQLDDEDARYVNDYRQERDFAFRTQVAAAWGAISFSPFPRLAVRPYLSVGLGSLAFRTDAALQRNRLPALLSPIRNDLERGSSRHLALTVPAALGFRAALHPRLQLELQVQHFWTTTDYLDGVSEAGDPTDQDGMLSAELGIRYRLHPQDTDADGVADRRDDCPRLPGPAALNGCPDTDNDGIRDQDDACPLAAGDIRTLGCPDSDGDGLVDKEDACPFEYGARERLGCPFYDRDQDGIDDEQDACPDIPGPSERNGCPAIDTDGDGLLDEDDACPDQFGDGLFQGCPDLDGDGIPDKDDACPDVLGLYQAQGCPQVSSPAEEAQLLEQQWLLFAPNEAVLSRFALLQHIVQFLEANPGYALLIRGYADTGGTDSDAHDWAARRAQATFNYFLEEGISLSRLQQERPGQAPPAAEAAPGGGDARNRRVEFVLYPVK